MVDFFYLHSSLPMLLWGVKPRITYAELLDNVNQLLGDKAAEQIHALSLVPYGSSSAVGKAWENFDTFLRNYLGKARAARLQRGKDAFLEHNTSICSPMTEHRLQEILQITSPDERELQLDKLRWEFLDSLTVTHSQDLPALEIYTLKLLLLEKIHTRQLDRGQVVFTQLIQDGHQQANQARVLKEH